MLFDFWPAVDTAGLLFTSVLATFFLVRMGAIGAAIALAIIIVQMLLFW